MTNQTKKASDTTEQNIEQNNFLQLIPEKVARYKSAFNTLALWVLISTWVATNEAKADTFDDLKEATIYYNNLNKKVSKIGEIVNKHDSRIYALEIQIDRLTRDNESLKENSEIKHINIFALKVDIKIGNDVFKSWSTLESKIEPKWDWENALVKIDSITDVYWNKYSFNKEFWIERKFVNLAH